MPEIRSQADGNPVSRTSPCGLQHECCCRTYESLESGFTTLWSWPCGCEETLDVSPEFGKEHWQGRCDELGAGDLSVFESDEIPW